jgi:hypothetical protein
VSVTTHVRRGLAVLAVGVVTAAGLGPGLADADAGHSHVSAKSKWIASTIDAVSVAPRSAAAWAVGEHQTKIGVQQSYVVRRTGSHWSRVKAKTGRYQRLIAIAAGSSKAVWAVGQQGLSDSPEPLIEHSSGGGFVPVKFAAGSGTFIAVAASSRSNAWAVGLPPPFTTGEPIVARWNGNKWQLVDDGVQHGYGMAAVSTSGARNVWILGSKPHTDSAGVWNGHTMRSIPIPVSGRAALASIATTGPKNTWVVGWAPGHGQRLRTLTEHWNGSSWKRVPAPSPSYFSQATSVAAAGKRVYLAGVGLNQFQTTQTPYLERFVHGSWRLVATPHRTKTSNLAALSLSTKSGEAVGFYSAKTKGGDPTELPYTATLHGSTWKSGTAPR